jgi:hypothetical protein
MRYIVQTTLSALVILIAYLIVYWNVFQNMHNTNNGAAMVYSLLTSLVVATLLWKILGRISNTFFAYIIAGGMVMGLLCFSLGFFGPLLLSPSSNQGPLLAIFLTGPLGVVGGFFVGGYYWKRRGNRKS